MMYDRIDLAQIGVPLLLIQTPDLSASLKA